MAERHLEISGASIVLLGSFNPAIFQPEWFARHDLLPATMAEAAKINVIAPMISDFETERVRLQVTSDRFTALSNPNAAPEGLRDLVLGTFFLLEHTPVTALGLNREMHFSVASEEEWHRVGDKLAPKEGWNGVLDGRPGMRALLITTQRGDELGSIIGVRVEPSAKIKPGVFFAVNEHYPAPKVEPLKNLMGIVRDRWEEGGQYAARIADHIMDWAGE